MAQAGESGSKTGGNEQSSVMQPRLGAQSARRAGAEPVGRGEHLLDACSQPAWRQDLQCTGANMIFTTPNQVDAITPILRCGDWSPRSHRCQVIKLITEPRLLPLII